MRILLVTPYYSPDLGPSAPMLTMLCEDLAAAGHQVNVIVAVPHFPDGFVEHRYRKGLWHANRENGVDILRVRIPGGRRSNLFHRLIVFFVFQILASLAGLRLKYDLLLITNPALETWLPFVTLGWMRRKPVVFAVWDIYPDVGIQLGIFRSPIVVWIVRQLENFCLMHASAVQTLTENMAGILAERVRNGILLRVIPPWLDVNAFQTSSRHNSFSRQHMLDDSFVVMYSGNLGYSQGLEHVLDVARRLQDHSSIKFVFIGDGPQRNDLIAKTQELRLQNVSFLPFQPRETLPEVFATADLALVSQQAKVSSSSLPSKTFGWMAAGVPILAFAEPRSDLGRLLLGEGTGQCVEPFDVDKFVHSLLELEREPVWRQQMGTNGRTRARQDHTRVAACTSFESMFNDLLKPRQ
jgi:colanic acid biosynthesis glycosyl transferase WcaI